MFAFHRGMELVELSVALRYYLTERRGANPLDDIGCFATSYVRGDYVPLISDAYHHCIALINRERHTGAPEQLDFDLPTEPRTLRAVVLALSNLTQQLQEIINEQSQQKNPNAQLQGACGLVGVRLAHDSPLGAEIQNAPGAFHWPQQTVTGVPTFESGGGEENRIRKAA
jgi:hypothetical protein